MQKSYSVRGRSKIYSSSHGYKTSCWCQIGPAPNFNWIRKQIIWDVQMVSVSQWNPVKIETVHFHRKKNKKKHRISIWYSLLVTVSGRGHMVYPTSPWGVTTDEIDRQAHDFIVANGMGIQWKLGDLLWHAGICFGKHDPTRVMYGNVSVIVLAICLHSTVSPAFISWSYAWSNIETQHIICQV